MDSGNQVTCLLDVLLEEALELLLSVEVLQVVDQSNMVDEFAADRDELVTGLLLLSVELLVQQRAEVDNISVNAIETGSTGATATRRTVGVVLREARSQVLVSRVLLDAKQQGVVHEVELAEDAHIVLQGLLDLLLVFRSEAQPDVPSGHLKQVLVLQSLGGLEVLALDPTVDHGTLQVEHTFDRLSSLHRVTHNDKLDWLLVLHLHRVDTVDSGQE